MSTEAVTSLDLYRCFKSVGLSGSSRVIVHASLKSFGFVEGGARTVVQVLLDTCQLVLMPAFTEDQTFVWPAIGDTPLNSYPPPDSRTREASPFRMDMPIDSSIGKIPESMRRDFNALRSQHPALSFVGAGSGAQQILEKQSLAEPLEPLRVLRDSGGVIALLGVDLTRTTAIHLGEREAGRHQFTRFALTERGTVAMPAYSGCSNGFNLLADEVEGGH